MGVVAHLAVQAVVSVALLVVAALFLLVKILHLRLAQLFFIASAGLELAQPQQAQTAQRAAIHG